MCIYRPTTDVYTDLWRICRKVQHPPSSSLCPLPGFPTVLAEPVARPDEFYTDQHVIGVIRLSSGHQDLPIVTLCFRG